MFFFFAINDVECLLAHWLERYKRHMQRSAKRERGNQKEKLTSRHSRTSSESCWCFSSLQYIITWVAFCTNLPPNGQRPLAWLPERSTLMSAHLFWRRRQQKAEKLQSEGGERRGGSTDHKHEIRNPAAICEGGIIDEAHVAIKLLSKRLSGVTSGKFNSITA